MLQFSHCVPVRQKNFFITGRPIAGTGAGLRPLGQDPNFVQDLREIFNISCPIRSDLEEDKMMAELDHNGNGRNKWPRPDLVSPQWRAVVSINFHICLPLQLFGI